MFAHRGCVELRVGVKCGVWSVAAPSAPFNARSTLHLPPIPLHRNTQYRLRNAPPLVDIDTAVIVQ